MIQFIKVIIHNKCVRNHLKMERYRNYEINSHVFMEYKSGTEVISLHLLYPYEKTV